MYNMLFRWEQHPVLKIRHFVQADAVGCRRRYQDAVVRDIEDRMAHWTHLPATYGEDLQVLNRSSLSSKRRVCRVIGVWKGWWGDVALSKLHIVMYCNMAVSQLLSLINLCILTICVIANLTAVEFVHTFR